MADFPVITSSTAVQVDQFLSQSGTTVTATTNVGTVLGIWVNGIAQRKTTDWSIAGQVVTFVSTLASDDVIFAYTTSQATLNGNISVVHQEFASVSGTTITLNQTGIGGVVMVARNGVVQRETTDYTVNYTTGVLTFTTTLSSEQVSVAFVSGGGGVGNATTLNGFTSSQSADTANVVPVTDASGNLGSNYKLMGAPTIYTTSGSHTYTVPTGASALLVELLGGGGGAAGGNASSPPGAGGGAYARSWINSPLSASYTVVVGGGGAGGNTTPTNGTAGSDSTFNSTTVVAKGGGAGTASAPGAGGSASSSTGDIKVGGGAGASVAAGGGGSGAGPYGGGMTPTDNSVNTSGFNGQPYGGGGGGPDSPSGAFGNGGTGADGIAVIWAYSKQV